MISPNILTVRNVLTVGGPMAEHVKFWEELLTADKRLDFDKLSPSIGKWVTWVESSITVVHNRSEESGQNKYKTVFTFYTDYAEASGVAMQLSKLFPHLEFCLAYSYPPGCDDGICVLKNGTCLQDDSWSNWYSYFPVGE